MHTSLPSYTIFKKASVLLATGVFVGSIFLIYTYIIQANKLVLFFLFALGQCFIVQFIGLHIARKKRKLFVASALNLLSFTLAILVGAACFKEILLPLILTLAILPLLMSATNQLSRLPAALFFSFFAAAMVLLIDLTSPWSHIRVAVSHEIITHYYLPPLFLYGFYLIFTTSIHHKRGKHHHRQKMNLATQYALVFSTISAIVISLVSGVLISQIRQSQTNQVGRTYQTIAENFAKLAGSHLEQQMQKLQMITEQVPTFKESLLRANQHYSGDKAEVQHILQEKNLLWEGPAADNTFIMSYLNNMASKALSRFRGHNSFHNDIILVDGYGGLVASLGQKPTNFYFFDNPWYTVSWNGGLGDIFIGDLVIDDRTQVPKIRLAVDVIDHTTNKVIGILSSMYLLRTLIEDINHFKPEDVDHISLFDQQGNIISSTNKQLAQTKNWHFIPFLTNEIHEPKQDSIGWSLGEDHLGRPALIGYSSLSTAYNVLSDPLKRLGWYIVVSGSQNKAMAGVTQSTKLALLVGLFSMSLGVLGAIGAARVITRPIDNLIRTAKSMSHGDLDKRAEPAGPQELVDLSEGFNKLTSQLHSVINNLKIQTEQLTKAKKDAETATRLKGEFLAKMSHEIRTPLNAILGFAEILESTIADPVQKQNAQIIKTSGSDLLHLINDILDLSKIEAGRLEIIPSETDIRQMFMQLKRIFAISAEEKNISLDFSVEEPFPEMLLLDIARLKQVLFNLLGNAVKFTEHGTVQCRARVEQSDDSGLYILTIIVKDTGVGIDHKDLNSIFGSFQQHSKNAGDQIEGTGLGLTISKNLIELMGGTISVQSMPGSGSKFTLLLPNIQKAEENNTSGLPPKTQSDPHTPFFSPASILIVDDLKVNRQLLLEKLKDFPFEISECASGKEAVSLFPGHEFDLILLDIRMPEMDGYETLHSIRKSTKRKTTPVIAITASGMKTDIEKIIREGFDDYLIRPFDQTALYTVLERYLPGSESLSVSPIEEKSTTLEAGGRSPANWRCPPRAAEILQTSLHDQWLEVRKKQNIPEIKSFADNVRDIGSHCTIEILIEYGRQLKRFADSFDIDNIEKHLARYPSIVDAMIPDSSIQPDIDFSNEDNS